MPNAGGEIGRGIDGVMLLIRSAWTSVENGVRARMKDDTAQDGRQTWEVKRSLDGKA
jgi:hypothetical protein